MINHSHHPLSDGIGAILGHVRSSKAESYDVPCSSMLAVRECRWIQNQNNQETNLFPWQEWNPCSMSVLLPPVTWHLWTSVGVTPKSLGQDGSRTQNQQNMNDSFCWSCLNQFDQQIHGNPNFWLFTPKITQVIHTKSLNTSSNFQLSQRHPENPLRSQLWLHQTRSHPWNPPSSDWCVDLNCCLRMGDGLDWDVGSGTIWDYRWWWSPLRQ